MYDCPRGAKYFACISSEPLFQYMPFVPHSLAHGSGSSSLRSSSQGLEGCCYVPHSLQLQSLQWPLQNPRSLITPVLGEQNWTQGYKCHLLGAEQKGIITSLGVLAALCSHTPGCSWLSLLPGVVARSCPVCCSPAPLGLFGRAAPLPLPLPLPVLKA